MTPRQQFLVDLLAWSAYATAIVFVVAIVSRSVKRAVQRRRAARAYRAAYAPLFPPEVVHLCERRHVHACRGEVIACEASGRVPR